MKSTVRSGRILAQLAVALAFLTAACGGDDASMRVAAQVDTIGGVVVVRNGTGEWRESERWQVVEEFRVGGRAWGENPDEELSYSLLTSVTLGPNGQIFVIEFNGDRVTVFSGDGEFVRNFGRLGEGPGEFRNPTAMAWDGMGRLWVSDFDGRYHVFDATGTFRKTVRAYMRYFTRFQHPLVWEAAGTLVEEVGDDDGVLYVRVDTLGQHSRSGVDAGVSVDVMESAGAIPANRFPPIGFKPESGVCGGSESLAGVAPRPAADSSATPSWPLSSLRVRRAP